MFNYTSKYPTEDVEVYWKKPVRSKFKITDNDKNAFVFHTNESFVLEKYKGKTKLTGNAAEGNCSLMILNIMENEPNIYVRVIAKSDNYSFIKNPVSISVSGAMPVTPEDITNLTITSTPLSTVGPTNVGMPWEIYVAIFLPVAALLIIIFVAGILFYIKRKRSQSLTREDSGYYANFSTASSNQARREAFCKVQDNKKLPEPKAIDEPVYINVEAPPGEMDHTDSVYANVDY
ncbi:uncharacterized protein [Enoplosus armatus]|uniref:uncharacterized protein n=1 Tax=Enoplosus armatus TaxID=215367 RepID=UPI0039932C2F